MWVISSLRQKMRQLHKCKERFYVTTGTHNDLVRATRIKKNRPCNKMKARKRVQWEAFISGFKLDNQTKSAPKEFLSRN